MIRHIAASVLVLCTTVGLCLVGFAAEGVPQLLNYQGKLTNSLGKPVDGSKQMIFEFHDAAVDGNLLGGFSETQHVVVTRGVFNVLIGSATEGGVPVSVFDGTSVYLSVRLEWQELSPRQRIASVAYAIRSAQADNASQAESASHADDAGSLNGVPASEIQAALADLQARVLALTRRLPLAPMCLVPAGTFTTSTSVDVYLDAYYIDQYEVTNELYAMFLNDGGNDDHWRSDMSGLISRTGSAAPYTYQAVSGLGRRPVGYVTWFDATDFCAWRSSAEGLPADTYRLPTEAEWEKAAGWGDPARTSLWTYAIQSDSIDCNSVNCDYCVCRSTDVGSYTNYNSYYGCYDMSGNVQEWCSYWYAGAYPSSTSNPTGPTTGTHRVLRGGNWSSVRLYVATGHRIPITPSFVYPSNGFRCARTLE